MLWVLSTHDFDLKTQDQIVVGVRVRRLQFFNVPVELARNQHGSYFQWPAGSEAGRAETGESVSIKQTLRGVSACNDPRLALSKRNL
jgi:hypothetical protein